MKASDFIKNLEVLIQEHGDIPVAVLEYNHEHEETNVIGVSFGEIFELLEDDKFFDENDVLQDVNKVILID